MMPSPAGGVHTLARRCPIVRRMDAERQWPTPANGLLPGQHVRPGSIPSRHEAADARRLASAQDSGQTPAIDDSHTPVDATLVAAVGCMTGLVSATASHGMVRAPTLTTITRATSPALKRSTGQATALRMSSASGGRERCRRTIVHRICIGRIRRIATGFRQTGTEAGMPRPGMDPDAPSVCLPGHESAPGCEQKVEWVCVATVSSSQSAHVGTGWIGANRHAFLPCPGPLPTGTGGRRGIRSPVAIGCACPAPPTSTDRHWRRSSRPSDYHARRPFMSQVARASRPCPGFPPRHRHDGERPGTSSPIVGSASRA